jgi:hypothetical protein
LFAITETSFPNRPQVADPVPVARAADRLQPTGGEGRVLVRTAAHVSLPWNPDFAAEIPFCDDAQSNAKSTFIAKMTFALRAGHQFG